VGTDYSHDPETRLSQSAFLKEPAESNRSDEDTIVHCIEARAAEFQGYVPIDNMETLQVVKYPPSPPLHTEFPVGEGMHC
jgi:hypothetical protein